jgi:dienelactone hydrolase
VAIAGHSFGGSLTVLLAAQESNLRTAIVFSGAGYSWDRSPALREKLLSALEHVQTPVFFIHAANDYSIHSGQAMDARLEQLGKPHQLKIYPAVGHTPDDGHDFLFARVKIWEADVFAFLDKR